MTWRDLLWELKIMSDQQLDRPIYYLEGYDDKVIKLVESCEEASEEITDRDGDKIEAGQFYLE